MKNTNTPALPPVDLTDSAVRVKHHASTITTIEMEAMRKSLLPRLLIGLHCLKAHTLFALVDASKRGKHNRTKKQVRADVLTTDSYEDWLATADASLKKTNTYRYMSAVRGLGCDETSTEEELTTIFQTYTAPTLTSLIAAAVDPLKPADPAPVEEQLEFDLMRDCLKANRQQCEELVASRDRLAAFPDLHKAACARLYQTLYELTGVHWQPSDEPNDYAHINPDHIEL